MSKGNQICRKCPERNSSTHHPHNNNKVTQELTDHAFYSYTGWVRIIGYTAKLLLLLLFSSTWEQQLNDTSGFLLDLDCCLSGGKAGWSKLRRKWFPASSPAPLLMSAWPNCGQFTHQLASYALLLILLFFVFPLCVCKLCYWWCVCVCVCVCVSVWVHVYVSVHVCVCLCVHVCACRWVCMHARMSVHVWVCAYACASVPACGSWFWQWFGSL